MKQTLSYNSGCLAVIIRLLFYPTDALWLWHRRKRCVIAVYFKMAPQRDNRVKVFVFFFVRDTKWVRSQTLSRCLAQPSSRSRSAWIMMKLSTDVQAVFERLLWIVAAFGMPFEWLLRLRDVIWGTACRMPFEG